MDKDKTQSIVLNLETLQAEYETILLQYNQVQRDYMGSLEQSLNAPCKQQGEGITQGCIDDIWHKAGCITQPPSATDTVYQQQTLTELINDVFNWSVKTDDASRKRCYNTTDPNYTGYNTQTSPNYKIDQQTLVDIQGQSFWGTESLGEGAVSSLAECKTMCTNNPKCTGATYNPDKKYCWVRGGTGKPIPSLENDYAIIPETTKYLNLLQALNKRLTEINDEIIKIIQTNQPLYESQTDQRAKQMVVLSKNVDLLSDERKKIMHQLQTHTTLNEAQTQTSITATRFFYVYLSIFSILIIIIAFLLSTNGSETTGGSSFLVIVFIFGSFLIYTLAK
jgi:hypothetical protein